MDAKAGMVVLTGDVHHASLHTRDQRYLQAREPIIAVKYARLAADAGVPITLFVTGRCAVENPREVLAIASTGAEIGGHTWDAFSPLLPRRIMKKLTRLSLHGPAWMQSKHIDRTLSKLAELIGHRPVSWRNHAYHNDRNTPGILVQRGVQSWSDEVSLRVRPSRGNEGLWRFPINVPPDHEHLYHAHRHPASVARRLSKTHFCDVFGSGSFSIADYERLVMTRLDDLLSADGVATLLLHPACMHLADGMAFFKRLLGAVSRVHCATMSNAAACLARPALAETPQ